jgi:23S rRNA pseudouridine1911/1915/1917 synthase
VPEDIPLDVIYEDEDLLVINKPTGLTVHPATGNWTGTLMNAVHFHFNKTRSVGDKYRSGLIHRLDKDTSGVVLIGKTNLGLWHYSKLFADRKVNKTYLAVCTGNIGRVMTNGRIIVTNYLGRNPGNRKKIAVMNEQKGRLAVTEIKLLKVTEIDNQLYSLVEVKPKTGRTHQIRVHLTSLGFPVLGDKIYGKANYSRLMLHAWKLKLLSPQGKELQLEAKLPEEFRIFNAPDR